MNGASTSSSAVRVVLRERVQGLGETQLDWRLLIVKLMQGCQTRSDPEAPALRFHAVPARGNFRLCEPVPERKVVLSGGVLQNRLLTEMFASQIPAGRLG